MISIRLIYYTLANKIIGIEGILETDRGGARSTSGLAGNFDTTSV